MVIKNYSVTLDSEIVEKAREKLQNDKLSPKINELLEEWVEKDGIPS